MRRNRIRTKPLVANRKSKRYHGIVARRAAIGRTAVAVSAVVIALVVVLGFTILSSQSNTQTATTTSTTVVASQSSSTSMTTTVVASQSSSTSMTTTTATTSASSTTPLAYLTAGGGCALGGKPAPCWGSPAYVFNCVTEAETQQGCTQLVSTTTPNWNYTINIRYPFSNQTEPSWANCLWSMQGGIPGQGYGYCSLVNSTSFTMGEPAPPPQ